jgi:hypothetical protein
MKTTVTNNNLRTKETLNQDTEFTNLKAKAFILRNIDLEGYDLENTADNLYNTFISEYGFMVPRVGIYNAFQEWLRGVPSAINLPIYYYDVNNVLEDELNALIYIRREYKEQTSYIQTEDDGRQYQRFLHIITRNFFELANVQYKD